MPGVIRLATGDYEDGQRMVGWDTHSDVLNEPSDAWRNILAAMTGQPYSVYVDPLKFLPTWAKPPWLRLTG
jgi:cell wall assembly regulator SMI1